MHFAPWIRAASLADAWRNSYEYRYVDQGGKPQTAHVQIHCPDGLSPADEFYLWGLLALTFAQTDPQFDFHATPHYCLRELGVISSASKGGKSYRLFRESLRRLAAVRYQNDRFWDPVRKEHRQVSFGFFSYSLPLDATSSRAWRIIWDPLFFEFCQATGSRLRFDLEIYRQLDFASRRLFLLLHKVFWRRRISPRFELRHLAVNVLGFSDSLSNRALKAKVARCAKTLNDATIICSEPDNETAWIVRRSPGCYVAQFRRGCYFDRKPATRLHMESLESPLHEPLVAIGFDQASVLRIIRRYTQEQVRLWSDVTLAAIERKGKRFFRRSPQAFFIDNIRAAAEAGRTPPDWFWAVRKEEEARQAQVARRALGDRVASKSNKGPERAFSVGTATESLVQEMTARFISAGQSEEQARANAERFAAEFARIRSKS